MRAAGFQPNAITNPGRLQIAWDDARPCAPTSAPGQAEQQTAVTHKKTTCCYQQDNGPRGYEPRPRPRRPTRQTATPDHDERVYFLLILITTAQGGCLYPPDHGCDPTVTFPKL
jgi:hypothetical protein